MNFNKEQLEAVNCIDGACGVIAGAGSGKSTTLVERVKTMTEQSIFSGIYPEDILIVTFTDNSSKDLKSKLHKNKIEGVTVGTFHSICKRILIQEGVDTSKQLKIYEIENELKKINDKINIDDIMSFIGYQKNYGIGVNDTFIEKESKYDEYELRDFYKTYENFKIKRNALDFDDWMLLTLDVLRDKTKQDKYSFKYILVDEHQDSNLIQNQLIDLLCPSGNIFCVFDYRQAIYTFRGGNPEYCMNFSNTYSQAKIINLNTNYRSCKNIVDNSNNFIKKYYGEYEYYKDSIANNKSNGDIKLITNYDKTEEADNIVKNIKEKLKNGVKPNEIAVLYRNNSNSFSIENELKKENIPYFISCKDGNFFNRKEINVVMCMLRLIDNPHDNIAYETVFNSRVYPFTYIKNTIRDSIKELSAKKNISMFEASELVKTDNANQARNLNAFRDIITSLILQNKKGINLEKLINNILDLIRMDDYIESHYEDEKLEERKESIIALKTFLRDNTLESFLKFVYGSNKSNRKSTKDDIQLMTIHASKGLEFDNVYLVGVEDGKFPSKKSPLIEEARLMYVATTRPKNNLTISQIYDDNQFVNEYFN